MSGSRRYELPSGLGCPGHPPEPGFLLFKVYVLEAWGRQVGQGTLDLDLQVRISKACIKGAHWGSFCKARPASRPGARSLIAGPAALRTRLVHTQNSLLPGTPCIKGTRAAQTSPGCLVSLLCDRGSGGPVSPPGSTTALSLEGR